LKGVAPLGRHREIYDGEHEPLVDEALFEAVRQRLAEGCQFRKEPGCTGTNICSLVFCPMTQVTALRRSMARPTVGDTAIHVAPGDQPAEGRPEACLELHPHQLAKIEFEGGFASAGNHRRRLRLAWPRPFNRRAVLSTATTQSA